MEIEWKKYKTEKPMKEGMYLWAQNNWNTRNTRGERVLTESVRIAYWKGNCFLDGSHKLIDPDQWVEVPIPPKAKRPLDDLNYEI